MQRSELKYLFNPQSIAIIGASSNPDKIGYRIIKNIIDKQYKGKLYLVSPKGGNAFNIPIIKNIGELPCGIDLAIFVIPKKVIVPSIKACIKNNVKFIMILTAGFKEIGSDGIELEKELGELVHQSSTRIIGPNCAGLCNASDNVHATFEIYPKKGDISFVSQSGSICSAFSSNLSVREAGISKYISLGNKLDINEVELIQYLGSDPETKVISLYLEDITDGRSLLEIASYISLKKPIIALKAGFTLEGAKATVSHTGAMSGEDRVINSAFRQMGIIRVNNLNELYDVSAAISILDPPKGDKIAIISDAGGPGVIATDAISSLGLKLAKLSNKTKNALQSFLPSFASLQNPIDMTFTREENLYYRCIEVLQDEDDVDMILITIPSHFDTKDELVSFLVKAKKESNIPIMVAWLCADEVEQQRRTLWKNGIPTFTDPQQASVCIKYLVQYGQWLKKEKELSKNNRNKFFYNHRYPMDIRRKMHRLIAKAKEEQRSLLETEAKELLHEYGLPVPVYQLIRKEREIPEIEKNIDYPIVMKIVSPDIIHKSEAGGVKVGIKNEENARKSFNEIISNARSYNKKAKMSGVIVYSMAPQGIEIIIGMMQDPQFGPVMMFGLGGIFVETLKDISFRVLPIEEKDAEEMIMEIKGYAILKGIRGESLKDIGAIKEMLLRLSVLVMENPEIQEIDLNPIFVYEKGLQIVDARVIL
jgi:acetyl coenzyme A synthetase (ADP forming)-like protein